MKFWSVLTTRLTSLVSKYWFWLIAGLTLLCRLPLLINNSIPFTFDHGKDSLAIMRMVLSFSPQLIGPWTSIPGLYFGPGWYYLMAPWYWLGGFHPVIPVVSLVVLLLVLVWVVGRFFGRIPAVIMAVAPTWLTISSSAWNPFPMPLVSVGILIGLWSFRSLKTLPPAQKLAWQQLQAWPTWLRWGLIGLLAGLGFHFSTAYAIFYPLIILLSLLWYRVKLSLLDWIVLFLGFALPFAPQAFFEVRHQFGEVKAILAYLKQGSGPGVVESTPWQVITVSWGEFKLAMWPEVWVPEFFWRAKEVYLWTFLTIVALIWRWRRKLTWHYGFELIIWIGLPILAYFKLHYNLWYVLGMLPVVVLVLSQFWQTLPRWTIYLIVLLYVATPISQVIRFLTVEQPTIAQSRQMLPVKLKTINTIRSIAGDKPFAVYHYVPDIYDFAYNYLYFWQAYHGQKLPTEFAYKPNAPEYIKEKPDLLQVFAAQQDHRQPELIFYVVESPNNPEFVQAWWNEQHHGAVIQEVEISPEVKLTVAAPAGEKR